MACTAKTKSIIFLSVGISFLVLAVILICIWPTVNKSIVTSQLSLSENSKSFKLWKETPIPMYLDLYLFNLTNADEKDIWKKKPVYEQLGPYVFLEKHSRVDVKWNNDDTVDFKQIRHWTFEPDLSNGSLDDKVTNLNVIAATVSNMVKDKHFLIRRAVNLLMRDEGEELFVTHTARELLFDGYEDKLLKLVANISIPGFHIPFDKFAWFYDREGNKDYDGLFKMYTGKEYFPRLGIVKEWNGKNHTDFYPDDCGLVDGTTGELWPPVPHNSSVKLFSSDMCSSLTLDLEKNVEVKGIEGKRFAATERTFDNGSNFEEQSCFNPYSTVSVGLRNVSQCRFGAPAFLSFPHFYLADENVRNQVIGMEPNETLHKLHLELEPNTGIPLGVEAKVQINIRVENISGIDMFANAPNEIYMPMLWFNQRAALTDDLASQLKLLLILPNLGFYTGYGVIGLGVLFVASSFFIYLELRQNRSEGQLLITNT